MATTLTATPLPDQAAVRLYLESTESSRTPVVMRDFTNDSALRQTEASTLVTNGAITAYASGLGSYVNGVFVYSRYMVSIRATSATPTTAYVLRPITGLTIGQRYRLSLSAAIEAQSWLVGIDGIGSKTVYPTTGGPAGTLAYGLENETVYEFVATATTHNMRVSLVAVSATDAYFWYSAIRVEPIPSALIKLETDFLAAEDVNWSVAGTPAGASSSAFGSAGINRTYARRWTWTSGTPNLNGASMRRTVTGLTIGKAYTIRVSALASALLGDMIVGFQATLGVVGIGATTPATWSAWRWVSYTFTATATSHVIAVSVAQSLTLDATGETAEMSLDYLRVDEVPSVPARSIASLTRSDVNGTTSVRLFEAQNLSGGVLVVSDYEAALTGLVSYEAVVNVAGFPQERAEASVDSLPVNVPVIAPATLPQYRQTVTLVTGYDSQRESATTVHQVVGRADPLVVLGPLRTRRGSLEMFATDYTSARALVAVYDRGEVVLLRQPDFPGMDMYHIATGTRIEPDEGHWRVTVDYFETKNPVGPLLGALGWTFDQAATLYPTFAAARVAFPTFNDYTLGPVG